VYGTANPETLAPPIEPRFRSTDDYLRIVSDEAGHDMSWFFDVYVRRGPLPVLELRQDGDDAVLEWTNTGDATFPMPVPVRVGDEIRRVDFDGNGARLDGVAVDDVLVDPYLRVLRKLPVVPTCEERREEEKG